MLEGLAIADFTAPGLLGLAIFLLLIGRIVPRSTLVEKTREAERWRAAYEAEREARTTSDAQTAELLELAKTTHTFLVAVFSNSEKIRQSGDSDVSTEP